MCIIKNMFSNYLKRTIQRVMISGSPVGHVSEMVQAQVEDLDFKGTEPAEGGPRRPHAAPIPTAISASIHAASINAASTTEAITSAMSLSEKIDFISGYKSLGIRAIPRLGLPSVWMSDATSGIRCYGRAAAFPSAVAMAASWDRTLIARAADSIAETARAKGISILLGPGVNIARVPTCGRNFEYFGEDPFLAGEMAAAYIQACSKRGVICTVKHLAANNSDYDRHKVSSEVDQRTLREIYLPAFETAVKKGNVKGVMTSYNPVNGVWASENQHMITGILRNEWGFKGFVVSDWDSLYSTEGPINAGLDIEMPKAKWLSQKKIKKAIKAGKVSEKQIDRMCKNLLTTLFEAGVYSRPVKDPSAREFHKHHEDTALETAQAGIVLLKNQNNTLPLPREKDKTIVVCGPLAEISATSGGGSCHVSNTTGTVNLAEGIKTALAGESPQNQSTLIRLPWEKKGSLTPEACATIEAADSVVIACGFNYLIESEFYDRPWKLPKEQREFIHKAAALNQNITVVITAGGDVETESWSSIVPAIVHGMYLGQSVGTATANVLLGRVNPSGRLPFTMARRWNDIPSVKNYPKRYWTTTAGRMFLGQGSRNFRKMRKWNYEEGLMVGYRHFDTNNVTPAFPFGHGLSYTDFILENMKCSSNVIIPDKDLTVSLNVRNSGKISGAVVIQIYVRDPECSLPRPEKELKGFEKVYLDPGESREVSITLDYRAFCFWDNKADDSKVKGWTAEPGEFEILAGESSRNISCTQKVRLEKA